MGESTAKTGAFVCFACDAVSAAWGAWCRACGYVGGIGFNPNAVLPALGDTPCEDEPVDAGSVIPTEKRPTSTSIRGLDEVTDGGYFKEVARRAEQSADRRSSWQAPAGGRQIAAHSGELSRGPPGWHEVPLHFGGRPRRLRCSYPRAAVPEDQVVPLAGSGPRASSPRASTSGATTWTGNSSATARRSRRGIQEAVRDFAKQPPRSSSKLSQENKTATRWQPTELPRSRRVPARTREANGVRL